MFVLASMTVLAASEGGSSDSPIGWAAIVAAIVLVLAGVWLWGHRRTRPAARPLDRDAVGDTPAEFLDSEGVVPRPAPGGSDRRL